MACAQAIFSVLENTHPPAWFRKFVLEIFFPLFDIISTQKIYIYIKNVIPEAVLRN